MSTCLSSFKKGLVLNDTWVLGERLGEGACGQVFSVHLNPKDPKKETLDLIIKCAYLPKGKTKKIKDQIQSANTIYKEHQLHRGALLGFKYAPGLPSKHRAVGEDHSHCYFVMQRLDYTLSQLATCGDVPSLKSISALGLAILDGLSDIHKRGYVFVDIKPDNFMILKDPSAPKNRSETEFFPKDKLFFVDYGLVEKVSGAYTDFGKQRANISRGNIAGNALYCSLDVHSYNVPAAKDDVEALGYMLLSLLNRCKLPWSSGKSDKECLTIKKNTDIVQLAEEYGCPVLSDFIAIARNLSYEEKPDYKLFERLLSSIATAKGTKKRSLSLKVNDAAQSRTGKKAKQQTENEETKESFLIKDAPPKKRAARQKQVEIIDVETDVETTKRSTRKRSNRSDETISSKDCRSEPKFDTKRSRQDRKKIVDVDNITSDEENVEEYTPRRKEKPSSSYFDSEISRCSAGRNKAEKAAVFALGGEDDDESDEEERGNTPVKVKKTQHAKKSPSAPKLRSSNRNLADSNEPKDSSSNKATKKKSISPFQRKNPAEKENIGSDKGFSGASSDGDLCLQVLSSDHEPYVGKVWTLKGGPGEMKVIGSAGGDDVAGDIWLEEDEFLSGRHALLHPVVNDADKSKRATRGKKISRVSLNVKDLNSTNGTMLNGKYIEQGSWETANAGDILKFGKTEVLVRTL